eukprot:TRINITY_DN1454_c0_g1_i6.p1 TRINITY_DN1454_c0_g1~~TRINITY_DN1454_c0_g1_i6.p1  ORF type:complete len:170 (-),score=30.58 TRINITY_DN1454_c0_g1_i6:455-964(-)
MGCSVGISTTILADAFASAHVTGLDLSAYFLAVASFRQKEQEEAGQRRERPITWKHGLAENTGLPDESFDLITLASVVHECPLDATRAIFREAHRLLRPGGTFACFDNAPNSKALQNIPPAVFTLLRATEPYILEYYRADLQKVAEEAGFRHVTCALTSPRHRTLTATK